MDNMIYIKIDNDTFYDDAIVLVRSFYPRMEVKAYKQDTVVTEDDKVIDITVPDMTGLNKSEMHDKFKSYLYDRLSQMTGKTLPWGYLTGVRPSKIAYVMLEDGEDEQTIKKHFVNKHKASEKKASLAINVAKKEMDILNKIDYKNGYSLYIGIPFCPSICLYCSFSSYALDAYKNYVDDYLDALIKEMTFVARAMKGRRLDTVYFGGGTPTTLGAAQLDRLITALKELFDIDGCHEFTVEAGRPDSITRDKLNVLKAHNVGRISINPQTMNQQTLDLIGRKHTVEQIKNVYSMAREEGFNNINMDIILGLVGEDVDEVAHTLSEIEEAVKTGKIEEWIIPIEKVFLKYQKGTVKKNYDKVLFNGNPLKKEMFYEIDLDITKKLRVYDESEQFIGIYYWKKNMFFPDKIFYDNNQ